MIWPRLRKFKRNLSAPDQLVEIERYLAEDMVKNIDDLRRALRSTGSGGATARAFKKSQECSLQSIGAVDTDVTNLSVTITASGPVKLMLVGSSPGTGSGSAGSYIAGANAVIYFYRDGSLISTLVAQQIVSGSTQWIPVSAFQHIDDEASPGEHTYKVRAYNAQIVRTKLVAYEL